MLASAASQVTASITPDQEKLAAEVKRLKNINADLRQQLAQAKLNDLRAELHPEMVTHDGNNEAKERYAERRR